MINAASDLMRVAKRNRAILAARNPGESEFEYVRRTIGNSRQLDDPSYLQLNPITKIWRVRIKVPRHLISFIRGPEAGLKHLTKSTGSEDEAEAKEIAAPIIEYYLFVLNRADRLFRGDLSLEEARRKDIISTVQSYLIIADLEILTFTERDIAETADFFDRSDQEHAFRRIPKRRRRSQPVRE